MIGEKIHNYEINAHLGQGGMGNVFRATDMMLGREVALKMLHPQLTMQSQFLERFKKEARVLAQLHHPNIAVIYNFIEQDSNHFMVMEYVEGANLDDLLKKYKSLPAEFVVPVFIQALEGLQHAHRKNIFHRDIKPANLMLTPDNTVKLMDFGIAKVAGEQKMTQVNKIVGTVEFMAPELIQGKDASALSDIYAMGATLYELISGKLPFESDTDFNLMQAILKKKVRPLDKLNASIPRPLNDIVMKALEKNPEHRYADARAFQLALINAFPHYREINLAALKTYAATQIVQRPGTITPPQTNIVSGSAMETRAEVSARPGSVLETVRQNISRNKRPYSMAAALLAFLIITSIVVVTSSNSKKTILAQIDSLEQNKKVITGLNDTTVNNPTGDNPVTGTGISKEVSNNIPPPQTNEPITPNPIKPETEKSKERKVIVKEPAVVKEEENKSEPEVPEEKVAEKKNIYIQSTVEVSLSLRTNLGSAPERQNIPVSFSVNRPVIYQGVTIIKQGAIASGTIKLGKILTDIEISSVTGANGQTIRLKTLKGHGRRSDLDQTYTAIVQPGTRMNF